MAKKRDPAVVSYTMSRIRSKDTSIELKLRKALWQRGLRYRIHYKHASGSPDIVFTRHKIAVFCDSTFWHGRDWKEKKKRISSNREYWINKIERNMERDKQVNRDLKKDNWIVLRFWDVEIEKHTEECVEKVIKAISERAKND